MKDKQGREYAKLSQLKAGDYVVVDDGFDCMRGGMVYVVHAYPSGMLYVICDRGVHTLDGQLADTYDPSSDDDDSLVGIYPRNGGD